MNENLRRDLLHDLNDAVASLNQAQDRLKSNLQRSSCLEVFENIEDVIRGVEGIQCAMQEGSYDHKPKRNFTREQTHKENHLQTEVNTLVQGIRVAREPQAGETVRNRLNKAA